MSPSKDLIGAEWLKELFRGTVDHQEHRTRMGWSAHFIRLDLTHTHTHKRIKC